MVLVIILVLATALRLLWLNLFPTSFTGDELTYILTAKSFALTGTDMSGVLPWWQILLFQYPPMTLPQAELPYFLLLPFVGGDFFLLRLPFALLGVVLVWLVYAVTKELVNRQVGLFAAFFTAISPWLIFINRTAYEMTPALVFYLAGFLVLLKTKGWKMFFALPFFILAFYSYIATKLVFLPFILLVLSYLFMVRDKRKYLKQYLLFAGVASAFIILFVVLLQQTGNSRVGDILLPNASIVSEQVDSLRRNSLQMPLAALFINKATVYLWILVTHLFTVLSGSYLFTAGDSFYGLWKHGLFYTLDALFLLIGGYFLAKNKKSLFVFLVCAIAIGLSPQILHKNGENFTPHLTFIFPFVFMVIAYGAVSLGTLWKRYQKVFIIGTISVYSVMLANFAFIYFYQYPIYGQTDFPSRLLSHYVVLNQQKNIPVVVYSQRSPDLLRKYLFYGSLYSQENVVSLRSQLFAKEPRLGNVSFKSCDETVDPAVVKDVIIVSSSCKPLQTQQQPLVIGLIVDSGSVYQMYNDRVCQFPLKSYISGLGVQDFAIESLSPQKFCQTFILSQ